MKKCMVMLMVLALAVVSQAAIIDLVVPGSDATLELAPDAVVNGILGQSTNSYTIELSVIGGDLAFDISGLTFPSAGWMIGNSLVGTPTDTWLRISGDNLFTANPAGTLAFEGLAFAGTGQFELQNMTTGDIATYNVVPEPMTIALLGLGGLFLRRRK